MNKKFEIVDYVIFGLTLSVSAGISFYFGFFGNKKKSAFEYLYGAGKMTAIPVGLSLLSSAVSAFSIVGTISEIYLFGSQFLVSALGAGLGLIITWKIILPVFCGNLNLKAPYEYFERRFDWKVRMLLSIMYVIHIILFTSIILYTSSISFSEATNIELYICTTVIGGICAVYTMVGGFSGVIWSDVLQIIIMISSCLYIVFKSFSTVGSFAEILYFADQGQRLNFFNFDPNPFTRITFWSALFGMCVINVSHSSCAASGIQRFMAVKSEKQAKISTSIQVLGYMFMLLVCGLIGLIIYVYYKDCDPVASKIIENPTQILPYFVNSLTKDTVGFTGLFTAGLLCAGLSTLSAELNAVSGLIYYDILQKIFKFSDNEIRAAVIMKGIIIVCGIIYLILAPLLQKFKYIFILGVSVTSWTYGTKLGVMILATTFPMANSWGAVSGTLSGLIIVGWISVNAMYLDVSSAYAPPVSIANCTNITSVFIHNITKSSIPLLQKPEDTFLIYKLSFMYYPVLGLFITIIVGLIVSYITGPNDVNKMDTRLIIPYLRPGGPGSGEVNWMQRLFGIKKTVIVTKEGIDF